MMSESFQQNFDRIVKAIIADPAVIGCLLLGSRGKQFHRPDSDYDLTVIVSRPNQVAPLERNLAALPKEGVDVAIMDLDRFREYAAWGGPEHWDRYDFAHFQLLWDPTGEVLEIAKSKGLVPPEICSDFIAQSLDGYINAVFRAVKCRARRQRWGGQLEAAASTGPLLDALFAFEHRVKPFYGYLEQELVYYPLRVLPWPVQDFLQYVTAASRGELTALQQLLRGIETLSREQGFDWVFDAWEGQDRWAAHYSDTAERDQDSAPADWERL